MNVFRLTGCFAVGLLLTLPGSCRRDSGEVGSAIAAAGGTEGRANARDAVGSTARPTPDPVVPAAPSSGPAAQRWQATADIAAGTVVRVRGVAAATPGPRLAGYLIQPGPRLPLSAEHIAELVALVRADSGFDDSVVKRCRPGKSIGFELVRKAPSGGDSTGRAVTELVLDFGCAKLTAATPGAATEMHTTYFDPSRREFVAFAKRVLPGDAEIRQLK